MDITFSVLRMMAFIMKDDLGLPNTLSSHTFCNEVEYPSSPIFQHYSRVEWLRDSKVVDVLVYLFLYNIDRHQITICPFSLKMYETLI